MFFPSRTSAHIDPQGPPIQGDPFGGNKYVWSLGKTPPFSLGICKYGAYNLCLEYRLERLRDYARVPSPSPRAESRNLSIGYPRHKLHFYEMTP